METGQNELLVDVDLNFPVVKFLVNHFCSHLSDKINDNSE